MQHHECLQPDLQADIDFAGLGVTGDIGHAFLHHTVERRLGPLVGGAVQRGRIRRQPVTHAGLHQPDFKQFVPPPRCDEPVSEGRQQLVVPALVGADQLNQFVISFGHALIMRRSLARMNPHQPARAGVWFVG